LNQFRRVLHLSYFNCALALPRPSLGIPFTSHGNPSHSLASPSS
jgi:hypothetical protein